MQTRKHLTLLIPGLLGPVPARVVSERTLPNLLTLRKLLSRSWLSEGGATLEAVACELFLEGASPAGSFPAAALSFYADSGTRPQGFVLRADPVHLRVDRDRVILFGPRAFRLDEWEAASLAKAFNQHFSSDRLELEVCKVDRWYLRLPTKRDICTQPLQHVIGRDISHFLPQCGEGNAWRHLLNETQMLFHRHPVNLKREQSGKLAINSLWFWGGGLLPAKAYRRYVRISAAEPSITGLARLAGIPVDPPPVDGRGWNLIAKQPGAYLHLDMQLYEHLAYGEILQWQEALAQLEVGWFGPLAADLLHGKIDSLRIVPADGREFLVTRRTLRRFWHPTHQLSHYLL